MSNKEIQNICVILLIFMSIATFPMPYDYYKLLRIISFLGFGYIVYSTYKNERLCSSNLICSIAALVYNPIMKIHLNREMWFVVNIVTIIATFFVYIKYKNINK